MLEPVELVFHATLHVARERLTRVYFPVSGWVSMLAPLDNGDMAEVGLVGKEGMIGLPLLLGVQHDNLEAMVQGQGAALAMSVIAFEEAIETELSFRTVLLHFAMTHLI